MLRAIKIFLISGITAFSLASCGGGGDSSDEKKFTPLTPKPDELYTGSLDPALLDTNNTPLFSNLMVGVSGAEIQSRPIEESNGFLPNQTTLFTKIAEKTRSIRTASSLQARTVSDSSSCEYGGTASLIGEVDDDSETGALVITFQNCQLVEGTVLNGQTSETITSAHDPEVSSLAYDKLSITQDGESYLITGTIDYSDAYSNDSGIRTQTEVINLASVDNASGISTYLKDYTIISESGFEVDDFSSITGKAYISSEGYVTLSTSSDYLSRIYDDNVIPNQGYIYLMGASTSKARISSIDATSSLVSDYRLDLDENGDGVYELTSIQDNLGNIAPLTENQAPIAVISANQHNGAGNAHNDDYEYIIGTTLYINSEASYDEDNTDLSYVWTIEEGPDGSTAEIINDNDGEQRYIFTPDLKGEYKISLKVTDEFGSQQSDIDFINVSVVNVEPTIDVSFDYDSYYQIEVDTTLLVFIDAVDSDTFDESIDSTIISYTWLDKPEGSLAEFSTDDDYTYTTESYGQTRNSSYRVRFDKVGTYTAEFKVTDSDGASKTSLMEVNVRSYELSEDNFSCSGSCNWETDEAKVGESVSVNFVTDSYLYSACFFAATSLETDSTGATEFYISTPDSPALGFSFTASTPGYWDINVQCEPVVDESTVYSFSKLINFTY